jgi:hypothetical protein
MEELLANLERRSRGTGWLSDKGLVDFQEKDNNNIQS